jgi:hypothetical protein
MLTQTKLLRFIIYRQNAGKGSTPVYDCSHTTSNTQAVKCFKDWGTNILQFNPNNFLCYEMLAFNDFEDAGGDEQNRNPNETNGQQGKKKGKMRISFALNAAGNGAFNQMPNQNNAPQIDIEAAIQKGIESALMKKELEELRAFKREVEDEDEDEDEQDGGDVLDKVAAIINGLKEAGKNEMADQINGDEMAGMTEIKNKHGLSPDDLRIKNANIKKAVNVLFKHNKNLDSDLLKLADLAENNPIVFKMILSKLRDF